MYTSVDDDPEISFSRMNYLKKNMNFKELSMGMSSDYLTAINFNSTYLRIGSKNIWSEVKQIIMFIDFNE